MKLLPFILLLPLTLFSQRGEEELLVSYEQANSGGAIPLIEANSVANDNTDPVGLAITVDKPTGLAANELCICGITNDAQNTSSAQWDATSDPTNDWVFLVEGGDTGNDTHQAIFYLVADGTEGSTFTFTAIGGAYDLAVKCLRISGINTSNPIGVVGTYYTGSGTSHAIPGITTGNNNSLALYFMGTDGSDLAPFSVSGTGWSEYSEFDNPANDSDNTELVFGSKDMPETGSTGDATVTSTGNDGAGGWIIEIRSE